METLLVGLALAAISGLTILASNRSKGYARLAPTLLYALLAIFVLVVVWDTALVHAKLALLRENVSSDGARDAIDARAFGSPWLFGGLAAAWAYLYFLLWLPNILNMPSDDGEENKGD